MSDRINIGLRDNSNGIHVGIREDIIHLEVLAGGAGGGGGIAIQGSGSYIYENGTAVFQTSPTVTFGLATNGIMTASALQSTHDHPYLGSGESTYYQTSNLSSVFLTTAALSNHTHSNLYVNTSVSGSFQQTSNTSLITSAAFPSADTTKFAGTATAGTNVTMTLNSNGLSLSVDPPGAGGGGAALKGSGTYTQNSGTIEFANSNSITFGLTSNQMTVSFSQSTHDHPYIATANSSLFQHTSATSNITSNAVNTNQTSQWLTTAALSNHTHDYQSTGNYLTTAALSDHTHSQYVNTSITSQWLTTAMASQNTSLFVYTSASSLLQHTSATSAITSNAVNTSVTSQWLTTAALSNHTHSNLYINTSVSGSFQLTSDNSLSLGTGYTTHTHLYQSTGAYITTAAGTGTTLTSTNGTAFKFTYNSAGLNIAVPPYITTAATGDGLQTVVAGDYISVSQVGNSVSISATNLQATSATSAITASAMNTSERANYFYTSNNTFLTTAALSNHTHSDLYINTSVSGSFQLTSDNSLSLGTAYTSHTHLYQSTGDYLTTAAQSNAVVNSINGSTGVFSFNTGSSLSSSRNGNSITWGLASNITSALQSAGAYLTTAMASANTSLFVYTSASSLFQHTSATSAITASALNTSQSSLFQHTSATSAITSNALNTSVSGSFQLTADNSLSLGTAYTTHTHNYQSTGNYLTTAALSNHTHSDLYIALGNSTAYQTSVLSNTFQTTGAYLTTAMASNAGSNFVGLNSSFNTTNGTDFLWTINSSGATIHIPKFITTYAGDGGGADWSISSTAGTNVVISTGAATNTFYQPPFITTQTLDTQFVGLLSTGLTGGSWTINSSQLSLNIPSNAGSLGFNDSNGVTFGVASTTSNSSTVVTASIAAFIGTATTITTTSGTDLKITAGTAGINVAHPAWITTYAGGGGGSWDISSTGGTNIVISTGAATNTLYQPNFITTYSPGGGGGGDWSISSTSGTDVVISTATNTITFYQPPFITGYTESTHAFTQYVGLTSTAITGGSATIASDRLLLNIPSNAGSLGFNDSNGVTFGIASTTSNSSSVVTASIAAYAGTSLSTVSTAGSVLLGGINTAGISLSVPAWLTTAAGAAASTYLEWHNFTGNSSHYNAGNNTVWLQAFTLDKPVSASSLAIGMTFNGTSTSAATQQFGMTHEFMLFERHSTNTTRYDSIWSSKNELTVWASGTSEGSYAFNTVTASSAGSRLVGSYIYGQRIISNAIGSELSAGFYMLGYRQSTSSAAYSAFMRSYNPVFVAPIPAAKNYIGSQTDVSVGFFGGAGRYSATSASIPTSLGITQILISNDLRLFFKLGAI